MVVFLFSLGLWGFFGNSFSAEFAVLLRAEQTSISLRYDLMSLSNLIHYLSNLLFPKTVYKKLNHISKSCLSPDQLNEKILSAATATGSHLSAYLVWPILVGF